MTSAPAWTPGCAQVLTFEQFAAQAGASRQDFGDAGNHRRGERHTDKTWGRVLEVQRKRDAELYERRADLRKTYAAKVRAGEITPPSFRERTMSIAMGHPDLASTQAARRLVEKKWGGAGLGSDEATPAPIAMEGGENG